MATLTVRDLDDRTKARLRVQAARHGRSMEAEARHILRQALDSHPAAGGLGTRLRARFAAASDVELRLPSRNEAPRAAMWEE